MRSWPFYAQQTFYYMIVFVILCEWLIPIVELTSTGYLTIFLIFIVICFIVNIVRIPFYISWLVKLFYISWVITFIYGQMNLFSSEGIAFLLNDLSLNLNAIAVVDFYNITNPLRTFLFFVLIWMLCYLIHYWLTVRHSIFYFLVLTVFFIATLDTFTKYDGQRGIIVTLLLGLLLTAVLYVQRLMKLANTRLTFESYVRYVTPIVFIISVVGVAAFFLPKSAPQWPDPVPFIKNLAGGSEKTQQSVGIDDDDSQLGGAFTGDDTVVYEIISDSPKYWRVETKAYYDSKGWINQPTDLAILAEPQYIPISLPYGELENNEVAQVNSSNENMFIVHTYGTHSLETDLENVDFKLDFVTDRITTYVREEPVSLANYNVAISEMEYSYTTLKQSLAQVTFPEDIFNSDYVQIPDTMPQRVRDLAVEITNEYDSVYDKAKAIERYFKTKGFRYETQDVAIPEGDQDYVDQFLFETKAGYCDNFSTSMVMLLRSVDIPARWVKGYAEGTDVGNTEDGRNIYEVTNNDAHSWVEVYVPEIGWMPFEPTIGFAQSYDIDFDMDLTADTPEADEAVQEQQQIEKEREEAQQLKKETKAANEEASNYKVFIVLLVLVVLSAGILLWLTRNKWKHVLPNAKQTTVKGAYRYLENRLAKKGMIRKQGETLRSFAKRVDLNLQTDEMTKFIDVYERYAYSSDNEVSFLEIKESYEYLINRLEG